MAVRVVGSATEHLKITSSLFDTTSAAFTVAFWMRYRSDAGGYQVNIAIREAVNGGYIKIESGDGGFDIGTHLLVNTGSGFNDTGIAHTYAVDTWVYYAITQSASNVRKGYIIEVDDTAHTATNTKTDAFTSDLDRLFLGGDDDWGEWVDAAFERFRVWTRELSQAELIDESNNKCVVDDTNLWADIPLSDNTDTDDISGNGHHFTVVGTIDTEAGPTLTDNCESNSIRRVGS